MNTKEPISGLTGLRGVAAIMVMIYHLPWLASVRGTVAWNGTPWQLLIDGLDVGVGLFFLLSGFLLAMPFWRAADEKRHVNLRAYAIRRAARILPGFWLALMITQWPRDRTWTLQGMGVFLTSTLGLDSWIHRAWEFRYLTVLWTVSIELMFYAMLPILFWLITRLTNRGGGSVRCAALMGIGVAAGPLYQSLALFLAPHLPTFFLGGASMKSPAISQTVFHYLAWFGSGCVFAWIWLRTGGNRIQKNPWRWELMCLASLSFAIWAMSQRGEGHWYTKTLYICSAWPWNAVALGTVILSAPRTRMVRWILDSHILTFCGRISYGMYLWHVPVTSAVFGGSVKDHLHGVPYLVCGGVLSFAATIFTAWLMHMLLEQPAMKWARQRCQPNDIKVP